MINWNDFEKVDIRVGTVLTAENFPQAHKPAYILTIDFGNELGIKKSSAQITVHYSTEELVGRQILAVVNFPPKQIGPIKSECLVLGIYKDDKTVVLIEPNLKVENGSRLG